MNSDNLEKSTPQYEESQTQENTSQETSEGTQESSQQQNETTAPPPQTPPKEKSKWLSNLQAWLGEILSSRNNVIVCMVVLCTIILGIDVAEGNFLYMIFHGVLVGLTIWLWQLMRRKDAKVLGVDLTISE